MDDIEENYLQKKKHTVKMWLTLAAVVSTYVTKQDIFLEEFKLELWNRLVAVIIQIIVIVSVVMIWCSKKSFIMVSTYRLDPI